MENSLLRLSVSSSPSYYSRFKAKILDTSLQLAQDEKIYLLRNSYYAEQRQLIYLELLRVRQKIYPIYLGDANKMYDAIQKLGGKMSLLENSFCQYSQQCSVMKSQEHGLLLLNYQIKDLYYQLKREYSEKNALYLENNKLKRELAMMYYYYIYTEKTAAFNAEYCGQRLLVLKSDISQIKEDLKKVNCSVSYSAFDYIERLTQYLVCQYYNCKKESLQHYKSRIIQEYRIETIGNQLLEIKTYLALFKSLIYGYTLINIDGDKVANKCQYQSQYYIQKEALNAQYMQQLQFYLYSLQNTERNKFTIFAYKYEISLQQCQKELLSMKTVIYNLGQSIYQLKLPDVSMPYLNRFIYDQYVVAQLHSQNKKINSIRRETNAIYVVIDNIQAPPTQELHHLGDNTFSDSFMQSFDIDQYINNL